MSAAAPQTANATAVSPEAIFEIASGFMAAKQLFIANEVGLFEALGDGPADLAELERRTGIARSRLRVVVDAMVALGFVNRSDDTYENGAVAAAFLDGSGEPDLRPLLRFWDKLSFPTWTNYEAAVRSGEGQTTVALADAEQRIFSEGVEAIQAGPAAALPDVYDFGSHRRLLDLGGGTGSWIAAILARAPGLDATLCELPSAARLARQRLASDETTAAVSVVAGDLFTDEIPAGHDVVLIANVLHMFNAVDGAEILRKTRAAVDTGARLLLADFWTDPTHTQPTIAALIAGEFLVITGEGDVYSNDEIDSMLDATGWKTVDTRPLGGPMSVVIAEAI